MVALLEVHDEWAIAERRYLSEGSMTPLDPLGDDGQEGVGASEDRSAGVLSDAADTVAEDHDGLLTHHSRGHGETDRGTDREMSTESDVAAVWGAITGSAALAIKGVEFLRDRSHAAMLVEPAGGPSFDTKQFLADRLLIHITNKGRQPIAFSSVGFLIETRRPQLFGGILRRIARVAYSKTYHPRLVRFSTPLHHFILSQRLEGVAPLTGPDDPIWRLDTYESRTIDVPLGDAAEAVVRAKQHLVTSVWPLELELAGERKRPGAGAFELAPYPANAGPYVQPRPRIVAFYVQSALGPRQTFPLRVGKTATFQILQLDDDALVEAADEEAGERAAQMSPEQYPYMTATAPEFAQPDTHPDAS